MTETPNESNPISQSRQWNLDHPDRVKINKHNYYVRHKQEISEQQKTKRLQNIQKHRDRENTYNVNNREKRRAYQKDYRKNNKDKRHKWQKEYLERKRKNNDPQFIILERLRSRIRDAVKVKGTTKAAKSRELIGCTAIFLQQYLESKFYPNTKTGEMMTWENRSLWHIDHIKPCDSFDLTDPEQQKQCFHYTNLQPLWAWENIKKGSKLQ